MVVLTQIGGHRRNSTVTATLSACAAVGLLLVVSAAAGVAGAPTIGRIWLGFLGVFFIGVALLPWLLRRTVNRPRRLIAEAAGLRWDDPYGTPWTVPWTELIATAVVTTDETVPSGNLSGSLHITLHSLELTPREATFPDRHPEMAHHWQARGGYHCYRYGLGDDPDAITRTDNALRSYAPGIHLGIIQESDP